jgi:hypothetical protein
MQVRNILLVVAVLAFALSVSFFGQSASRNTQNAAVPSGSLEKIENPVPASLSAESIKAPVKKPAVASTSTSVSTSSPKKTPSPAPVKPQVVPQTTPVVPAPTSTTPAPTGNEAVVSLLRNVTVNILCTSESPEFRSTSGSGIFIGSQGLILTAAHVVEFMLLTDYTKTGGSCIVRTGSPAEPAYRVKLAYISPTWVRNNATAFVDPSPTGTGEDDFAILAVVADAQGHPITLSHAAVTLADEVPDIGEKISIGTYGAEFLSGSQIQHALYPIIDFEKIDQRYTFGVDTVDLIEFGGGASQEGSSGGGVLNAKNEIVGLITTSSAESKVGDRHLHAITPGHIMRSFLRDMKMGIEAYTRGHSPSELSLGFDEEARSLAQIVINALAAH